MLSPGKKELAEALVDAPDADAFVAYMLKVYAERSAANARNILQECVALSKIALAHCERERDRNREALGNMIALRQVSEEQSLSGRAKLAAMLPACMAIFPDGKPDPGASRAELAFFQEVKGLVNDPNCFDPQRDSDWARTMGYGTYVWMLLENFWDASLDGGVEHNG